MQPQFRVKLLERVQLQSIESVLIKEIVANSADEAMDVAVRLLAEEYAAASWVTIDPCGLETTQQVDKDVGQNEQRSFSCVTEIACQQ
jgi:hypothetical protein